MSDVVSYLCVRADHQWGSAEGTMHPLNGSLAYCPDAGADGEAHAWQECGGVPRADVDALLARLHLERSAVA